MGQKGLKISCISCKQHLCTINCFLPICSSSFQWLYDSNTFHTVLWASRKLSVDHLSLYCEPVSHFRWTIFSFLESPRQHQCSSLPFSVSPPHRACQKAFQTEIPHSILGNEPASSFFYLSETQPAIFISAAIHDLFNRRGYEMYS